MEIGVLGNAGSWYVNDLHRAATQRGHKLERLEFPRLTASLSNTETALYADTVNAESTSISNYDAVIVRTMPPGTLEQVVYRMDFLAQLQRAGVHVLNSPRSLECAVDKFLTTARLADAGLPIPRTIVCENSEAAMLGFEQLGNDVVVKPLFGSEGRGILRVSDPDLAFRTFRTLERLGTVLYLQEFIHHPGYDLRVLVLDGEILGGMKRISPDDFRTNVSRNSRTETFSVTDEEAEWAIQAAQLTEARIAGVDLLCDQNGNRYLIEVNAVPGWKAFQKTTGCDVARKLIEALEISD